MFACNECKMAHEDQFRPRRISPGQTEYPMQPCTNCVECGFRAPAMKLCLACALSWNSCQICRRNMREVSDDLLGKVTAFRAKYRESFDAHAAESAEIRDLLIQMDQAVFAALVSRAFEEEQLRERFVSELSRANLSATPHSYESKTAPQAPHTLLLDSALSCLTEAESTEVLDHSASFSVGRALFRRMMDESNRLSARLQQES
jgi:hypothetical protein